MKHLLHKLSSLRLLMLLAVLLGMGSSAAWGQDLTFDFEDDGAHRSSGSNSYTGTNVYSQNDVSITLTYADAVTTGSPINGTANAMGRVAKNTTNSPTIVIGPINNEGYRITGISCQVNGPSTVSMAIHTSTDNSNWTSQQSPTPLTGATIGRSVSNLDITSSTVYLKFTLSVASTTSSNRDTKIDDIVITREAIAPASPLASIALSGEYPTTFLQGDAFSHEGMTVTATYDDTTTKDVTASAEFTGYDMSTTGNQTVTVSYTENEVTKTADYNITVNAPVSHNVTWSVNGETTVVPCNEGAAITFPEDPADVSGKTFVGWTTEAIAGSTNEPPTFVTSATMGTSDVTYYAVFAYASGGGSSEVVDVLNYEWAGVTGTNYSSWSGNKATSSAVYAGNTAGGNEAIQLRSNNSNSGIVTTTSGGKATKLTVEWNGNTSAGRTLNVYGNNSAYSAASELYNNNTQGDLLGTIVKGTSTEVTINGDYEYIGIRSASGALYLDKVEITWSTGGGVSYSAYCTTVVAATVEHPAITVASSFTFSTSVEMSCETDGATIYYTLDGTAPTSSSTKYDEAFSINATTTINAIAIKGNDQSLVATVTATKNLVEPTVAVSGDLTVDLDGETNVSAGTLTAAVTYNEAAVQGAVVAWSSSDEDIATIDANGAVTLLATGEVTFTATYAGNNDYAEATGTKTITVINSQAPGTEARPYTVAEAIDAIDNDGDVTDVYVAGIVSQVDSYNSTYHSITYWISEDGTTTSQQFEVYSGKDIDGADFSSKDDIQVGDIVVIKGNITYYSKSSVYEFSSNNQLVSLVRKPAAPTFSPVAGAVAAGTQITLSTTTEGATIYYTMDGIDPTTESNEYTSAITITDATTIKAIAVKGTASSDVATAAYTIAVPVATPTFSPAAGTFDSAQEVAISCETVGATIYYSYDNENWTEYTEPLNINETKTVYAKAEKEGSATSAVASAEYIMKIPTITFAEATPKNLTYEAQEYDFAFVGAYTTGSFAVVVCDYEGNATTYDWFSAELNGNAVRVTLTQNVDTENGRTAYFKVTADNAESEIFSVVQGNFVVDYAELPFAFNDGKAAIEETTGLTQNGLGSDYASAPKLKFDTTGDNLVLKINERPGTLTFDIKGNSFSGGTFKVQTSEDGTVYSDLETYTGLGDKQEESFDNLGENVRYIKWIYTSKNNGNVALGNIALAEYVTPAPAIVAPASVELKAEDTAGEIAYSINNPDGVSSLNATCEDGWISNIEVTATKVTFTTAVNTGAERVGTITLSYTGATDKVVTVTQAEAVVMLSYSLATTITSGKHYIITNGSNKAMGAQNANNRAAVDITIDGEDATFASNAGVAEFVICGPYANGYYTIYDASENGYLYAASSGSNYLKTKADIDANDNSYWTIGIDGSGVATIQAKGNYTRNVMQYNDGSTLFACYSSASQGEIYLFEKYGEVAPTESITIGAAGYTTYTTQNPISVPSGVKAYIATAVNASTIHLEEILDAPARTPIILQAETPNTYTLEKDYAELYVEVVKDTPNILKSSDGTVTGDGSTIYALGVGKVAPYEGEVGFYVVNDGQTVPAGKAYLTIAQASSVKEFLTFDFGELPTGLNDVRSKMEDVSGDIFNLAGQKMNRLQKGINIVNGKKIYVK